MSETYTIFVCNGDEKELQLLQGALAIGRGVSMHSFHVASLTAFTKSENLIFATLNLAVTPQAHVARGILDSGCGCLMMSDRVYTSLEHDKITRTRYVYWDLGVSPLARHRSALLAFCGFLRFCNQDGDHAVGLGIKSFLL